MKNTERLCLPLLTKKINIKDFDFLFDSSTNLKDISLYYMFYERANVGNL